MLIEASAYVKEKKIYKLTLEAVGDADLDFLTRLHKALILGDDVDVSKDDGHYLSYNSGGVPEGKNEIQWDPIPNTDN